MKIIPLHTQLSPLEIYSIIRVEYHRTVLLESLSGPDIMNKQSIICFNPQYLLELREGCLIKRCNIEEEILTKTFSESIIFLRKLLELNKVENNHGLDHFIGGLLGFTSFDFIRNFETIEFEGDNAYPEAMYAYFDDAIIYEHSTETTYYISQNFSDTRFEELKQVLSNALPKYDELIINNIKHHTTKEKFMDSVNKIKEDIIAGEVFQTVISQRITFDIEKDYFRLYLKLRERNPSPYMYCMEFDEYHILGSSPELLIEKNQFELTTFPIAGTRPVTKDPKTNQAYAKDLLNDEKELAEHNMLVDLARNDLGKVSKISSVKVSEYKKIGIFSHVMHIISKVQGKIKSSLDQFDAFFAVFPAGTVSGAPKIRSMEIIRNIEMQRGPYAGAVGYFGLDGNMVQAITIRTIFGKHNQFNLQAGAGIVADSQPENEYYETLNKMMVFLELVESMEVLV
ncbi:MAG: anthranilate synthase component I family protein [Candidatus Heimdallarchaeota archaeon]|nr:anthranilate synthase component I family protein [Candidatus Heimdallarchaeota archaeon]